MVPDEGIYREKTWHWIPKMVRIPHFKWLKFSIRKNCSARYPDSSFSVSFKQFFCIDTQSSHFVLKMEKNQEFGYLVTIKTCIYTRVRVNALMIGIYFLDISANHYFRVEV